MFKTSFSILFFFFTLGVFSQSDSLIPKVYYFEFSDNKSSEGFLLNEKPEGYWKTFYESSIIKSEGNRKNHLLDSIWKFYSEEGFITTEITYKENKKTGPYKLYGDSGILKHVFMLENDVRTGEYEEYYPLVN